jgi:hypothetical protein
MKTKHSFSSSLSYLINSLLSVSLIGGPSLSLAAGEVVRSTPNAAAVKSEKADDVPTPEEIKMGAVKSPYKACKGVVIVERSPRPTGSTRGGGRTTAQQEWDAKKEFWEKFGPGKGCDAQKVDCTRKVQFIPDTHFYKTFDGRAPQDNFTSKESANDFLARVAAASALKAQTRIDDLKKEKACLESGKGDCMKAYLARMEVLKTKAAEFRLQVARYSEISDSFLSKSGTMPNNPGILVARDFEKAKDSMVVPAGMPDLTTAERAGLIKEMKTFLDRAFKENEDEIEKGIKERKFSTKAEEDRYRSVVLAKGRDTRWIKPQMDAQREKALASYLKLLADYPELGYVNAADLNVKSLPAKLALAIKDAEESLESMKEGAKAVVIGSPGEVHKKRLAFAAHSQTIEDMLAKEGDGHSCAVANATLNELATVRTKEGLVVGGISVAAMALTGVIGSRVVGAAASAGLITEAGVAVGGKVVGGIAFLAGAVPGVGESYQSVQEINDQVRDARVGIVKPEEAQKALDGKAATEVMSLLNFQGSGHYLAAGAGLISGAYAKFLVSKSLKDAAKAGGGGAAGKAAADALIADIAKAGAGDKAAAASVAKVVAAEEKRLLGTVAAADRAPLEKVIESGLVGTAENPDPATLKKVVSVFESLQGPNKADYPKEVVALRKAVPKSADPAREVAVNSAIADVAGVVPLSRAKEVLADQGFDVPAITGWAAVVAKMRDFKGTIEQRFLKAWEYLRVKAGLAKEKVDDLLGRCRCGKICPLPAVAGPYDGNPFGEIQPKVAACAIPTSTTL